MKPFFEKVDSFEQTVNVESFTIVDNGESDTALYTIAIPTYNRWNDLEIALQSAINQETNVEYNIIVVDNNPERDDNTEKLIKEKYSNTPNFKYYKNAKNLGMVGNWNRLITLCHTEYIIFLHDDDKLFPYFIKYISQIIDRNSNFTAINSKKCRWDGQMVDNDFSYRSPSHYISHSLKTNYMSFAVGAPSGFVLRVADAKLLGGYNPDMYPSIDYEFVLRLLLNGFNVITTTDPLMYYRVVGNTTMKKETQYLWMQIEYPMKEYLGKIMHVSRNVRYVEHACNIKLRLHSIKRFYGETVTFKGFKPANKIFLVFRSFIFGIVSLYQNVLCRRKL